MPFSLGLPYHGGQFLKERISPLKNVTFLLRAEPLLAGLHSQEKETGSTHTVS